MGLIGFTRSLFVFLFTFVYSQEKCGTVCNSPGLLSILQIGVQPNTIPSSCKRGLIKALVLVGSAQEDSASREQYWSQVIKYKNEKLELKGPKASFPFRSLPCPIHNRGTQLCLFKYEIDINVLI